MEKDFYFKVFYTYGNGSIGTWEDYAENADSFVEDFVKLKGERKQIGRINRLEKRMTNPYKEIKLSAAKYNRKYGFRQAAQIAE